MHKVRLIHWRPGKAEVEISKLRAGGYEVDFEVFDGPPAMRRMKEEPPAAVIIDLTRLPSQGRDVALAVRHAKTTRHIPIVLVGGEPEKVERIQKLIPDAVYTDWNQIAPALDRAILHPLESPVVPKSILDGYADAPLLKKLGIKADTTLALIDAPPGFPKKLGELPAGVSIRNHTQDQSDLIIWFTKSQENLDQNLDDMAAAIAPKGGLWIAWPKKASGEASDLSQTVVRKIGLAAGLVDYKVCSIDETWSGLKFTRRKSK
jgi:hypothetical protein